MRTALLSLATVGLLILPTAARGEDARPHGRPDPETLFKQLDKNHDGVITAEEIPDNAPPPVKALLKPGDKKGITKDQFMAAVKERREAKRHAGPGPADAPGPAHRRGPAPGPRPDAGPGPAAGVCPLAGPGAPGPRDRKAGGPPQGAPRPGPCMAGGPQAGRYPGPGMAVPPGERKPFDVKALFAMFDKDKDGKLSLDEFAEGMKRIHDRMMARFHGAPPMAGHRPEADRRDGPRPEGPGPMVRRDFRAGPPPAMHHAPCCPCCERGPMMPRERHGEYLFHGERPFHGDLHGEFRGEFRGEMDHPRMHAPRGDMMPEGRHPMAEHRKAVDGPKDGPRPERRAARPADPLKAIEAKLQEMDAKLKAIEARLPK